MGFELTLVFSIQAWNPGVTGDLKKKTNKHKNVDAQ